MGGSLTPIVKNLLLINVALFIATMMVGPAVSEYLALYDFHSSNFKPYQFLSYMFMHGSLMHIFGNMFALYVFGPHLERLWGGNKFISFYLITGIGAGLIYGAVQYYQVEEVKTVTENFYQNVNPQHFYDYAADKLVNSRETFEYMNGPMIQDLNALLQSPDDVDLKQKYYQHIGNMFNLYSNGIRMVGASGAIFGILLAFGMMFPNVQLMLLFPPIPIRAKYLVMFYGAYELYAEFRNNPGDNVAHLAHLAGMLIGFIMIMYWRKKGDSYRGY